MKPINKEHCAQREDSWYGILTGVLIGAALGMAFNDWGVGIGVGVALGVALSGSPCAQEKA